MIILLSVESYILVAIFLRTITVCGFQQLGFIVINVTLIVATSL
jgi:hypothetical protein